jgi:phospholipid transport system transporter-binding protein
MPAGASAVLLPVEGQPRGQFRIEGAVSFVTAPELLRTSESVFRQCPALELDLAGVTHADSAALALMLLWMERAQRAGASIRFRNTPEQLLGIARISDLESLLVDGLPG